MNCTLVKLVFDGNREAASCLASGWLAGPLLLLRAMPVVSLWQGEGAPRVLQGLRISYPSSLVLVMMV